MDWLTLCIGIFCFCFTILLSIILQVVGFFTPYWVVDDTCSAKGLFYTCCVPNNTADCTTVIEHISAPLGLEGTALCFYLVSLIFMVSCLCVCAPDSEAYAFCFCIGPFIFIPLYPLAGLFGIIGCIVVGAQYPTSSLGLSFYLCLASNCYTIIQIVCICCCCCCCDKCWPSDKKERYGVDNPQNVQDDTNGDKTTSNDPESVQIRRRSSNKNGNDRFSFIDFRGAQFAIPKAIQNMRDRITSN